MNRIKPIEISRAEVLRCLGYRGQELDEKTQNLITQGIRDAEETARPRTQNKTFALSSGSDGTVTLGGTGLVLPGRAIAAHLSGCRRCVLTAATLGIEIDNRIRTLQTADLIRALILDAAASVLIEGVCDALEQALRVKTEGEGYDLSGRFSPGYGDFPLSFQPKLLSLLDSGRRMGLYCSEAFLMTPGKSVTAILGIQSEKEGGVKPGQKGCGQCGRRKDCAYRKEET